MFDIGWTEMLVIAIVMIVVVGPKDLPRMLRTFGKTTAKLRGMAGDFQKQFNDALKEAELDDLKNSVDELRGLDPRNQIKKHLDPFKQAAADVRAGVDSATKPSAAQKPAEPQAHAAEPLKNGAAEPLAGVNGPTAMPESKPAFPAASQPAGAKTAGAKKSPARAAAKPAKAAPKAAAAKASAAAAAGPKNAAATSKGTAADKPAATKKPAARKAKPAGSAT